MKYSEILKETRTKNNYTQNDIAIKLGINRSTYKDYELQNSIIPIKHLIALSNLYNISIDYMLGLTNLENYSQNSNSINKEQAGKRLKEFRKENKLTQEKLANILNTTFSNIAFYEKGRNLISTTFLYDICKKYNISADYLLGRIDNPKYLE
jgi:transcriptional regulator with XRE-family HTH domain